MPKPSAHRGGVAILVRKPLGLLSLRKGSTEEGQFVTAQLLGFKFLPFTLTRRPLWSSFLKRPTGVTL